MAQIPKSSQPKMGYWGQFLTVYTEHGAYTSLYYSYCTSIITKYSTHAKIIIINDTKINDTNQSDNIISVVLVWLQKFSSFGF